jgi:hypothetical protein
MNKGLKNLIFLYFGFVIVKVILAYYIPSSKTLADDYNYLKMSESFFYHFSLKVHDNFNGQFLPLYPILISLAQIFKDNNLIYIGIKVINSLSSSLIIFPAYYLSKEFLLEKKSLLTAIVVSLLPGNFALVSYIMAENLFYTLFLFSIYFIYLSFKDKNSKYYLLMILFSLLTLFTKIQGLILIPLILILIFYKTRKEKFNLRFMPLIILILITIIFLLIYFKNIIDLIYTNEILALMKSKGIILAFIIKIISYIGFLLLSSFILMIPLIISFKIKNIKLNLLRKISLITVLISIFLAANHGIYSKRYFYDINGITIVGGRIIGRYVDFVLPLITILGFIGLDYYFRNKNKFKKYLKIVKLILILIMIISTSILLNQLVPFNNISLTLFGVLKYFINLIFYSRSSFEFGINLASYLIISSIFILFPIITFYLLNKLDYRKFISLLIIFFIVNGLISFGVVYYAASTSWYYNSEQRQIALYLNEIDSKRSIVLIDERDNGDLVDAGKYDTTPGRNEKALYGGSGKNLYTILGYWLNDELIIGNVNNLKNVDYVISTYKLNLEKIYETKNNIYLYKVH